MDVAEEVVMGSSSNDHHLLVVNKGKRTKRQRPCSPVGVALINNTSTSSSEEEEREAYYDDGGHCLTTTSAEFTTDSTEEEEDMANCLILLAQGYGGGRFRDRNRIDEEEDHDGRINRRMMEIPATTTTTTTTNINGKQGVGGYYVYKCKTCNRCFPSFQALGGHRASHKKPKSSPPPPPMVVEEKNKALALLEDNEQNNELNRSNSPSLSLHLGNTIRSSSSPGNNNKSKVHECSICGSEFSSGQALGGHMRRHRPSMTATTTPIIASESQEVTKKERSVLSLDLNLPAPEDDTRDSNKFSFSTSKQQPLVFSASALVDCHY